MFEYSLTAVPSVTLTDQALSIVLPKYLGGSIRT